MKRLKQIAKEQNIGVSKLIGYFEMIGHKSITQNSKVDPQLESQIIPIIENPQTFENNVHKFSNTSNLPTEFNAPNPFQTDEQEIVTEGDKFSDRPTRKLTFQDLEIMTVFSDFEAYSICKGLENKKARKLARNYFKSYEQIDSEQFEAHRFAMSALEKYGGQTLTYIISLPPLPFKAVNATQIFSELDKRRKKQDFPVLRILFKNMNNQTEKITVSYYAENTDKDRVRNNNVLNVKNRTTGQQLMLVSRSGIVLPKNSAKQIVPVLQVFVRFSKDTMQTLYNYGLETGECSICGRELTDSESVRIGIGPICRQNI